MEKKVGSVILATDQGLGYLAKDFFDNGIIDYVLIREHGNRQSHRSWYPRKAVVASFDELLEKSDSILFFETPFEWRYVVQAREKGKKTVLMPMYECTPNPLHYEPDLVISPSVLDQDYFPDSEFVPVPVPKSIKWKLRKKAKTFIHNAGNGGIGGRNGTRELLMAMQYIKSPIKLIVRSQVPIKGVLDPRVELRIGTFDDIWDEGDVFIFPEKFNGLSLPLQEAFASGMLVMCGDRRPMNTWLPKEPLIPVSGYSIERVAVDFYCAQFSPETIAAAIDRWYNKDIKKFSLQGKEWAKENSWRRLKKKYKTLMSA